MDGGVVTLALVVVVEAVRACAVEGLCGSCVRVRAMALCGRPNRSLLNVLPGRVVVETPRVGESELSVSRGRDVMGGVDEVGDDGDAVPPPPPYTSRRGGADSGRFMVELM